MPTYPHLGKLAFATMRIEMIKKILLLSACFILLCSCNQHSVSHDFEVDGIYYKIVDEDSRLAMVTYKGRDWNAYDNEYRGAIVIPNIVTYRNHDYSITEIGDYAFRDCSEMTSIAVSESVWHIGREAFSGCEALKEIHINNLSAWCEMSFYDVLDDAGDSPFHYADGLYLNGKLITDLVVPEDVTEIGAHAFEGYEKLRSVVLHDGIDAIYKSAFFNCCNLTDIELSKNIYYIGAYAFDWTPWYENKPDGEVYARNHFYKYKGEMPVNTSIVIKEGTETICESAFDGCEGLSRITIPSSMRCIHDYAFCGCNNLKEIYCKGHTPPYLNNFYSDYHNDVVLYVPKGAKETYRCSDHMGYFNNVVETDF